MLDLPGGTPSGGTVRFDPIRAPSKNISFESPSKGSMPTSPPRLDDLSSPRSVGIHGGPSSTTAGESTIIGDVNSTLGPFGSHSSAWRHSHMAPPSFDSVNVSIRKKDPKKELPASGAQDFIKIRTVVDVYKAVRILVGMVANCWTGKDSNTQSQFQKANPGLVKVRVGRSRHIVPGFLLQDMEGMLTQRISTSMEGTTSTANATMVEVTCKLDTPYFKHIVMLLKVRWLLRLHSACCELDYKMCSCANLIKGIHHVSLQQCAEMEADSIFSRKVSSGVGAHINMESVIDDVFDQLQRSLGAIGWRSFIEFASTCDPTRSVHHSRMDMGPVQVVPNHALMTMIDTIFVASFLRTRRDNHGSDLKGCYDHLEKLGIPLPELPPLRGAQNLRMWVKAKTKPTRQDRDRVNRKDMEKLAQLDVIVLCAALELQLPEVMATADELREMHVTTTLPKSIAGDVAPEPMDFGSTGKRDQGPPAARVMLVDKPQASPLIFNAVVSAVHHHVTFPHGIRERMYKQMVEMYGLTREQSERLAIALTQNVDGPRLSRSELLAMEGREKVRLRNHEVATYKDCSHLLVSSLVAAPAENHKLAKYTLPAKPRTAPATTEPYCTSSVDFSKSLPDLRGFKGGKGKHAFKVPLSTGPLTMDPDLHKLRTTGFFIKMPPLRG